LELNTLSKRLSTGEPEKGPGLKPPCSADIFARLKPCAPIQDKGSRFRVSSQEFVLFCEELADVCEGLEFEGVSGGVEEEHSGLFTDFAIETDVGLDDEGDSGSAETIGEDVPCVHGKDDSEVGDRDVVAIDGIVVGVGFCGGLQVGDDLVAEEIEVDPLGGAAAFGTAQSCSVEGAGGFEVVDGKGNVKGSEGHYFHHTMGRGASFVA
jgi:hypothetical protein